MYTIQILSKETRKPTPYLVTNRDEIVEYIFDDGEKFYETKYIGTCMRKCIEIMNKYPMFLAKVIRK